MTTPQPTFAVGQLLRCTNVPREAVYGTYLGDNTISLYPSLPILTSHHGSIDYHWEALNVKPADCSKFYRGEDAITNVSVGDKLACVLNPIDNNKTCPKNRFTYLGDRKIGCNTDWVWNLDDKNYPDYRRADCTGLSLGPPMSVDSTVPPRITPIPSFSESSLSSSPSPSTSPSTSPSSSSPTESGLSTGAIIGIVAGGLVFLIALLYFFKSRK